jgi:hypothetical protein
MITTLLLGLALRPATVSLMQPCAHSSVVLAALGEEIGREIEPRGSVKDDYFLLRFDEVPVQEALDKIAETLNATWSQKDGVLLLDRTREQEREDAAAAVAVAKEAVDDWLEKELPSQAYSTAFAAGQLEQILRFEETSTRANRTASKSLDRNSPLKRFLARIVEGIGSEALSKMRVDDVIQLSTDPQPGQLSLSGSRAMAMLRAETDQLQAALDRTKAIERKAGKFSASYSIGPYVDGPMDFDGFTTTVFRREASIWVTCDRGRSVRSIIRFEGEDQSRVPPEIALAENAVEWSKPVSDFVAHAKSWAMLEAAAVTRPGAYTKEFSDPVESDLLSLMASDWILESSAVKGRNVVALMADDLAFLPIHTYRDKVTEGQLWSLVGGANYAHQVALDDDWLTITPKFRDVAREKRIDRKLFHEFIRRHKKEKVTTIDSASKLVSSADTLRTVMLAAYVGAYAVDDPSVFRLMISRDSASLRMYHELNAAQKIQAHQGGVVAPIPSPQSKMNLMLKRFVNTNWGSIRQAPPADVWEPVGGSSGLGNSLRLLSGRLPRGSKAHFRVVSRNLVYPKSSYSRVSNGYTPSAIGKMMGQAQASEQYFRSDYREFYVGGAQRLAMDLEFPGIGFLSDSVQVDQLPDPVRFVQFEGLPLEAQDEIKASKAAYLKTLREGGGT